MSSENSFPFLLVIPFLLLLATPPFVARAGFGRRAIWFGVSALFFLLSLINRHIGRSHPRFFDLDNFFGLCTEDIDLPGLLEVLFAYGAISLAVAWMPVQIPVQESATTREVNRRRNFEGYVRKKANG
jgi:hypothetical protein